MSEPMILTTLRTKADQLEAYINTGEDQLKRSRADLVRVLAVMAMYETPAPGQRIPPLFNMKRLFRPGEIIGMCREALAEGDKSTRELAEYVSRRKEAMDVTDRQMVAAIGHRIAQTLSHHKGRTIEHAGRLSGRAVVWRLIVR